MVEKIDSCTISLAMHNIYTDVVYSGVYCVVDDLWGQPIKLIQVVSTSDIHEYS